MKRTPLKRKRSKPRRGPWRSVKYRKWISLHWCCVKYPHMGPKQYLLVTPQSQAAHTANNGMSSKGGDETCVPLSPDKHREYDAGRKAFEAKYNVNMREIAASYYQQWLLEGNKS